MPTMFSRSGLMLGAIGIACAFSARADDFGSTQALLESGLFLSQAEADAVYSRLDAPQQAMPAPGSAAYWESGAVGIGQSERSGRLGWSGDARQMRLGAEQDIGSGVRVGAAAGAAFGGLGSEDLSARTASTHADVYARVDRGSLFAKALLGGSSVSFEDVARSACHANTAAFAMRAGGQIGGVFNVASFRFTPTLALTATGLQLDSYRETGTAAAAFASRRAVMTSGAVRLSGARSVTIAPQRKIDFTAFVGADEVLAFGATGPEGEHGGEYDLNAGVRLAERPWPGRRAGLLDQTRRQPLPEGRL